MLTSWIEAKNNHRHGIHPQSDIGNLHGHLHLAPQISIGLGATGEEFIIRINCAVKCNLSF